MLSVLTSSLRCLEPEGWTDCTWRGEQHILFCSLEDNIIETETMHEAFAHKDRLEFVLNRARNRFTAFTQGDARSCSIKSGLLAKWWYKRFHGLSELLSMTGQVVAWKCRRAVPYLNWDDNFNCCTFNNSTERFHTCLITEVWFKIKPYFKILVSSGIGSSWTTEN
jgi:hypothetical protein